MENLNEESLINKMTRRGILTSNKKCSKCNSDLKLTTRKRNKESKPYFTLRCTNSKCQNYQSLFANLFFSLFRKPFMLIIEIIKCWCVFILVFYIEIILTCIYLTGRKSSYLTR